LAARLTTLLCEKKVMFMKSKEVKTTWSNSSKSGRIIQERLWVNKGCLSDNGGGDSSDDNSWSRNS
jgi:hypothetical protein